MAYFSKGKVVCKINPLKCLGLQGGIPWRVWINQL